MFDDKRLLNPDVPLCHQFEYLGYVADGFNFGVKMLEKYLTFGFQEFI